ncbi:histidine phosphatase family protein [Haloquadratum walsbyi]|uniref:histidine phosphatase family protein n=1 Tax=Haloquadratum walsbyi TaxID=293091 RepID=UPI00028790EC|nr:histidine phosphatase family protein [Haloquadratum walsbyi]
MTLRQVYSLPFLRTIETASEICAEISKSVAVEPVLGGHRNLSGLMLSQRQLILTISHYNLRGVTQSHDPEIFPPYPESPAEVMNRIGKKTRQLTKSMSDTIVLVGHGVISSVVDGLIGTTAGANAPLCGITRIDREQNNGLESTVIVEKGNNWQLRCSGDTTHLDA